jgi:excisionase family DNA binding protein
MASIGDDLPELMTIEEVANFLRVSKITLKRWGKRGKLPAIRINQRGDRRYKKEAVLWLVGEMYKKNENPKPQMEPVPMVDLAYESPLDSE